MIRQLKILQANHRKMSEAQYALLNDTDIQHHTALLIQEPSCFIGADDITAAPPRNQPTWQQFLPTSRREERYPIRSLIYAKQSAKARQVPVDSPDITAVEMIIDDQPLLLISVYVPCITGKAEQDEEALKHILSKIIAIKRARPNHGAVIAGDFNRHDQLWGGDAVSKDEGAEIINMMDELELVQTVKRGTPTYQSGTTIDLMFISASCQHLLLKCEPWSTAYGSDHDPIDTWLDLGVYDQTREPRRLFRNTNWTAAKKAIADHLLRRPAPPLEQYTQKSIEEYAQWLEGVVQDSVLPHTPVSKPSPYSKRWWSLSLTQLRKEYTAARNEATSLRRAGAMDQAREKKAQEARKRFHDASRRQRRTTWLDFLDDSENIWKASRFLHPAEQSSFGHIPGLQTDQDWVTDEDGISKTLMAQFFEQRADADIPSETTYPEPLAWHRVTEDEVHYAVRRASPWKAPGRDGIPNVVWQKLWPELHQHITALVRASIESGHIPSSWKIARILPLRKPGKPDYTVAKAYRPISLLATISKVVESVLAERISYYDETAGLLPKVHFGARKMRSTVDALAYLTEHIHYAWKARQVLSLVSFDVKGAFNGVNGEVLSHKLKQRRIPYQIVRWINQHGSQRKASIAVNGVESEVMDIEHAGIPQGSPLSAILFLFYNADLVASRRSDSKGSIAFADDYNAWVVGPDPASNIRRIHEEILPGVERWSAASGSTFESDKTKLIHFTRMAKWKTETGPDLRFQDQLIKPVDEVKVLGVVLDRRLSFRAHAARAAKRGERAALALRRLKGLRPQATRQLFLATVAPVIDYGAPIWWPNAQVAVADRLNRTTRLGAIAIAAMYRTASGDAAAAEASIDTSSERQRELVRRYWIKLHTKPLHHLSWKLLRRLHEKKTHRSPLEATAKHFQGIDTKGVQTVDAFTKAPWRPMIRTTTGSRNAALSRIKDHERRAIYTNAATEGGSVGVAAWNLGVLPLFFNERIGTDAHFNKLNSHLEAIKRATAKLARKIRTPRSQRLDILITNASSAAIRLLTASGGRRRHAVQAIHRHIRQLNDYNIHVEICWAPKSTFSFGSDIARKGASAAATEQTRLAWEGKPVEAIVQEGRTPPAAKLEAFRNTKHGQHLKRLDQAAPGKHIRKLYDMLTRTDAAVLSQLRAGYCGLNSYLYSIKRAETKECTCGSDETVEHFLLQCPRWDTERQRLQDDVGPRSNELSYLLGGYQGEAKDGPRSEWKPNLKAVKHAITFAKSTERFRV